MEEIKEHHCDSNCKHEIVPDPILGDKPNDSGDYFNAEEAKKAKDKDGSTGVGDGGGGSTGLSGSTGGDREGGRRFLRGSAAKFVKYPSQVASTDKSVGPNAKCPCGSGKKYKKCCMWK